MAKRLLFVDLDLERIRITGLDGTFEHMVWTPEAKVGKRATRPQPSSGSKDLLSMTVPRQGKQARIDSGRYSHSGGTQLQICQPCEQPDVSDDVGDALGISQEDYVIALNFKPVDVVVL